MTSSTRTSGSTTTYCPRSRRTCTPAFTSAAVTSVSRLPLRFSLSLYANSWAVGGRHFAEGSYDVIAQKLFQTLDVNTFYLEYDTERAGGFEPLQYLPKNKNVVVGVISTKLPQLENKEDMKKRVISAAEWVAKGSGETTEEALKRVCVSPQCGFSTHESGYPLNEKEEKEKLSLIRAIADEIWGEP